MHNLKIGFMTVFSEHTVAESSDDPVVMAGVIVLSKSVPPRLNFRTAPLLRIGMKDDTRYRIEEHTTLQHQYA
jgi:hypothetical protein